MAFFVVHKRAKINSLPLLTSQLSTQLAYWHIGTWIDPKLAKLVAFYFKKPKIQYSKNQNCQVLIDALGKKVGKQYHGKYLYTCFQEGHKLTSPMRRAIDLLYEEKIVRKKNGVHPVVKTWIPFKGRWEQRKILRALTPNERLIALRQAYKRKTK